MRTEMEVYNEVVESDIAGKIAVKCRKAIHDIYVMIPETTDTTAALICLAIQSAYYLGHGHGLQEAIQTMRPKAVR